MLAAVLAVVTNVLIYSLILLVGLWCWYQVTHWEILRAVSKLPTPGHPLPIIGHAHHLVYGIESSTKWILKVCEDVRSQGLSSFCLWIGPFPIIVLVEEDDIQKVLNMSATIEKPAEYDAFKFIFGDSLVTVPYKVWKVSRRYISPMYHPRNLEFMIPEFNRNSQELVNHLSAHVGDKPFDVHPHVMDTAILSVSHFIFGMDMKFDQDSEEFHDIREMIEKCADLIIAQMLKFWLRIGFVFKFLYRQDLQQIYKTKHNCLEDRLKIATEKQAERVKDTDTYEGPVAPINLIKYSTEMMNFFDVYKYLQKIHPNFTDERLRDEIMTMYAGGTDTMGALTSSCLLSLAYHTSIQEKVYQEIMLVVGEEGDVTSQDLLRMPYLDQVYKETHRFYSITPFIGRKSSENIEIGEYSIPSGCNIIISLESLNMNSRVFPDPKTFDPEHFSPDRQKEKKKYSFLPYGGGPRVCIGKQYAGMLMKIMVVHILRRYKLTTKMDIYKIKKKLAVTFMSVNGYHLCLEARN